MLHQFLFAFVFHCSLGKTSIQASTRNACAVLYQFGRGASRSFGGAIISLTFSTTSGGVLMIDATSWVTSSPASGVRSMLSRSVSVPNAGSDVMVIYALRNACSASGKIAGGAT